MPGSHARRAPAVRDAEASATRLTRAGLDTLDFGFAIFDRELELVASNKAFRTLRGYPPALCKPGTGIVEFYRYNARRGDYGPGDVELHAQSRMVRIRARQAHELEHTTTAGQVLRVRYTPIADGGLVLTYADITARKEAEERVARTEAELHVALDNMPGALIFTDEALRVVFCNDRFADMYPIPRELLQRGRSYVDVFRWLAEQGYYGEADVDSLVAARVESLRHPTDRTLEDRTADGRVYRVARRKVAAGGTVTVITDVTELRRSEEHLERREAELHVALDNMPGALVYTDTSLEVVVANPRFADLYALPRELLERGRSYLGVFRYLAERGYYGEGDTESLVAKRVESLRDPSGKSFEDFAPDGRVFRVVRRKVDSGGTVTVITDVSELKEAEKRLHDAMRATEEANRRVGEQNRELEALASKLSKYLPPQLYRQIFSGAQTVEVASKRKKLTIFFSDIAGFTETTDMLESEELTGLLNQYLQEMSAIALEHGATIDKFIGDAIMVFFGDPESRGEKEDALACVRMAIAMQRRMRDLQAEWRERGQEHVFQLRIGINTGFCTVGNFGSANRVDYTIIGNEVNLASRLQTHADLGGILLAHETWSLVKDEVLAEETGTITVKGFSKPVRTHRVVGLLDDAGFQGRVIRQEQEGLLLIIDRVKLGIQGRDEAIRLLQEAAERLRE
ncbi:adenylate cyclase [Burkholderiales bacterium]|nr:adenylate cyclase [Burkholderiales bacterium]